MRVSIVSLLTSGVAASMVARWDNATGAGPMPQGRWTDFQYNCLGMIQEDVPPIEMGSWLLAVCNDAPPNGTWSESTINLNHCINNDDGTLYWGGSGYHDSCSNMTMEQDADGAYWYKALCDQRDRAAGKKESRISLSANIGYNNGSLVTQDCHGREYDE